MMDVEEKVEEEVEEFRGISKMAVKLKEVDTNEVVIEFKDTRSEIVNSIRRVIIDDVNTFAIEDVEIIKNESPLYDETLSHRLGLVPLSTNLKDYNRKENCKCGGVGCALCEVNFSLKSDGEGYVYSKELKSDDPQITPVDEKIPLTKVFGKKEVDIRAKAVLGSGREHAKWAPAHAYLKENGSGVDLVLELHGQLSSKDTFNSALDILVTKIEEVEAEL